MYAKVTSLQFVSKNMTETFRFSSCEEKNVETSDDFYPASRHQDCRNTTINSLQINLNGLRTQLRSCQYEQASLKDKLNDLELKGQKLIINNEFLSGECNSTEAKKGDLLNQKSAILGEIKDWKDATGCLKVEANRCGEELIEWKRKVVCLEEQGQELKEKIKVQNEFNEKVEDYSRNMEGQVQQAGNELAQLRVERDNIYQTLSTLETFAKSFKKNILQKEKELARCQFQTSELESMVATKSFEKVNFHKEQEKSDWQSKIQIEKTNSKLQSDLERLMAHLQSLKKSNKQLNGCIKDYSQTGIVAAKKILIQSNK